MSARCIYHISRGYRKVTIWHSAKTGSARNGVSTCTPHANLSRYAKWSTICDRLRDLGVARPTYVRTKSGK